jgi:hypothetical protein
MLTFLDNQLIDFPKCFRAGVDVSTCVTWKPLPDNVTRGTYTAFWPLSNTMLNVFLRYHKVSQAAIENNGTAITTVDETIRGGRER